MKRLLVTRYALTLAAAITLVGVGTGGATAQEHRDRGGHPVGREAVIRAHPELAHERWEHHVFLAREVGLFRAEELALWGAGHWYHEWHNGRFGWWYFVDGSWYFYEQPVYPYPLVVSPTVYVEPAVAMVAPPPGPVAVAPAPGYAPPPPPPAPMPTAAPAPPQYWYFCDASQTYYPYAQTCAGQFRPVPIPSGPPPGTPR